MGIETYQEKNTRAMEKELAQSDIPVKRKVQKTIQNTIFQESVFSDGFGWFGWEYIRLIAIILDIPSEYD